MLDEEFSFPTYMGNILRLRVVPFGRSAFTHEQRVRSEEAFREMRLAVEWNFEPVVFMAQRIHRALHGVEPVFGTRERISDSFTIPPFERLLADLESDFQLGRLIVIDGAVPLLGIPPEFELTKRNAAPAVEPPLPPIARPSPPDRLTLFEVRFVDEIGQAIGGLEVELKAGSLVEKVTTNPAGVAIVEDVASMSASVSVLSSRDLEKILDPRWQKPRVGTPPSGVNTSTFAFTGAPIPSISLKPAVPNTVVITPPFGKLFVELFDKTGRVRHKDQKYEITGPETFSGRTDAEGRLLHVPVARGNYELSLTVEVEIGADTVTDTYKSPLVVLESPVPEPQVRMIGVLPRVVMARMRGLCFDTNKCFLLPTAKEAMQKLREIYAANNPSQVLIVGHTDTTAEPDINDPLSKERADSVKAYLEDDVDAWLQNYDLPEPRNWGSREDRLMLSSLPDFPLRGEGEDIIEWFQRTRGLDVDGKAGEQTRTQLIEEYMALDGISLKEEPDFRIEIQTHGAGENFPLVGSEFELDQKAADETEDPFDRRVELFFFDVEFGVLPAPGAADGDEYLEWRKRSVQDDDFPIEGIGKQATIVEAREALFRTNSCVVLPEGETPSSDEHEAVTSIGLFAAALRFNEENPGRKLFIAGHTDTTATVDFNQKLSLERAKCALAILEGDRAGFVSLAKARHVVADYKQILSWCAKAFVDLAFDCDPGVIDDNAATGIEPVKGFQRSYNANRAELGAPAAIQVDGAVGDETWGAFFDVYQFGIRDELGEDAASIAALRKKLVFVDDKRKALGFSEFHPVDQIGRDDARSQANRRIEVLFFEAGEEPDLQLAESDPDVSELFLPGMYDFAPVEVGVSVKKKIIHLQFVDSSGDDLGPMEFRVETDTGFAVDGKTENATIRQVLPSQTRTATLIIDQKRIDLEFTGAAT